jgi:GntR family transcriptional repressor for pyruvate dehydrogenase complex
MAAETDPRKMVALDTAFHAALAAASGNRVFEDVIREIRPALAQQSEVLTIVSDRKHDSDQEHRRILAAIERGDAEAASAAMRAHLGVVGSIMESLVAKGR